MNTTRFNFRKLLVEYEHCEEDTDNLHPLKSNQTSHQPYVESEKPLSDPPKLQEVKKPDICNNILQNCKFKLDEIQHGVQLAPPSVCSPSVDCSIADSIRSRRTINRAIKLKRRLETLTEFVKSLQNECESQVHLPKKLRTAGPQSISTGHFSMATLSMVASELQISSSIAQKPADTSATASMFSSQDLPPLQDGILDGETQPEVGPHLSPLESNQEVTLSLNSTLGRAPPSSDQFWPSTAGRSMNECGTSVSEVQHPIQKQYESISPRHSGGGDLAPVHNDHSYYANQNSRLFTQSLSYNETDTNVQSLSENRSGTQQKIALAGHGVADQWSLNPACSTIPASIIALTENLVCDSAFVPAIAIGTQVQSSNGTAASQMPSESLFGAVGSGSPAPASVAAAFQRTGALAVGRISTQSKSGSRKTKNQRIVGGRATNDRLTPLNAAAVSQTIAGEGPKTKKPRGRPRKNCHLGTVSSRTGSQLPCHLTNTVASRAAEDRVIFSGLSISTTGHAICHQSQFESGIATSQAPLDHIYSAAQSCPLTSVSEAAAVQNTAKKRLINCKDSSVSDAVATRPKSDSVMAKNQRISGMTNGGGGGGTGDQLSCPEVYVSTVASTSARGNLAAHKVSATCRLGWNATSSQPNKARSMPMKSCISGTTNRGTANQLLICETTGAKSIPDIFVIDAFSAPPSSILDQRNSQGINQYFDGQQSIPLMSNSAMDQSSVAPAWSTIPLASSTASGILMSTKDLILSTTGDTCAQAQSESRTATGQTPLGHTCDTCGAAGRRSPTSAIVTAAGQSTANKKLINSNVSSSSGTQPKSKSSKTKSQSQTISVMIGNGGGGGGGGVNNQFAHPNIAAVSQTLARKGQKNRKASTPCPLGRNSTPLRPVKVRMKPKKKSVSETAESGSGNHSLIHEMTVSRNNSVENLISNEVNCISVQSNSISGSALDRLHCNDVNNTGDGHLSPNANIQSVCRSVLTENLANVHDISLTTYHTDSVSEMPLTTVAPPCSAVQKPPKTADEFRKGILRDLRHLKVLLVDESQLFSNDSLPENFWNRPYEDVVLPQELIDCIDNWNIDD